MKKLFVMFALIASLTLFCGNGVVEQNSDSTYELQQNEVYIFDENLDLSWVENNNCYTFAIGRYAAETDVAKNPGEYSGQQLDLDFDSENLANLIKQDLELLR